MSDLRIPGPTPLPDEVLQILSKQMINHRGSEFLQLAQDATGKLKQLFQTRNDVLMLSSSGTGGLEAAIVNSLSPGEKVLSVSIGVFGDRFATIARQFGANVIPCNFEWGKPADPDTVRKALQDNPGITSVLVTHNETSTGITNDLGSISKVVKEFDKLLLVDAISSLGAINLPLDEWQCDVTVTGSQKGWMAPPGMAMVCVSERGWQANAEAKMPRFYWDLAKARKAFEKGQTPWTPAETIVFAFSVSLDLMLKEGLDNIVARHARVAKLARDGVQSLGFTLFAQESHASSTVTSINAPKGLDVKNLLRTLRRDYNVELAGGQSSLSGKIFRIGHLGWVFEKDIDVVISALKEALPKTGLGGKQ